MHPYHTARLEEKFVYEIDGKVTSATRLDATVRKEAFDAINTILNLNESVLMSKRESLIDEILNTETYKDLTADEIFAVVEEFRSVIQQYAI